MASRFDHLIVFVAGEFTEGSPLAACALAIRAAGPRVFAFGTGPATVKRILKAHEIDVDAVGRSRAKAQAAMDGLFGVWDAIVATEAWEGALGSIAAREREQAFLDVRIERPILRLDDPANRFLRTPEGWAAFTAARAGGANQHQAKEFARQQTRGHKRKDRDGGARRGTGTAASKRRTGR